MDTFAVNTWHHLAFCRVSGTYKFYVDGVHQSAADVASGSAVHDSSADWNLGHSSFGFLGYSAETRFTKHALPFPLGGFSPPNRMH